MRFYILQPIGILLRPILTNKTLATLLTQTIESSDLWELQKETLLLGREIQDTLLGR